MTNVEKALICDALIRLLMVQETTSLSIVDTDKLRDAVKAANAIKPDQDYTEDDLLPWKSQDQLLPDEEMDSFSRSPKVFINKAMLKDGLTDEQIRNAIHFKPEPSMPQCTSFYTTDELLLRKQQTIALMAASIYAPDRSRGVFSDFDAYVSVVNNLYDEVIKQTTINNKKEG